MWLAASRNRTIAPNSSGWVQSVLLVCGAHVKEAANHQKFHLGTRFPSHCVLDWLQILLGKFQMNLKCASFWNAQLLLEHWCASSVFHGAPKTRRPCHQPGFKEDRDENPSCSLSHLCVSGAGQAFHNANARSEMDWTLCPGRWSNQSRRLCPFGLAKLRFSCLQRKRTRAIFSSVE